MTLCLRSFQPGSVLLITYPKVLTYVRLPKISCKILTTPCIVLCNETKKNRLCGFDGRSSWRQNYDPQIPGQNEPIVTSGRTSVVERWLNICVATIVIGVFLLYKVFLHHTRQIRRWYFQNRPSRLFSALVFPPQSQSEPKGHK